MIAKGHKFVSETDTEVVAHLMAAYYDGDFEETVKRVLRVIEGSYSLVFMCAKEPEKIIQNINALRSKQIRSVAKDITNFAQDALMLHVIFPRSIIEVTPDFNKMVSFTESDIQGMKKEILKIKQKSHDVKNWLLIPRAFYWRCDVRSYKYLFAEDKIINDSTQRSPKPSIFMALRDTK